MAVPLRSRHLPSARRDGGAGRRRGPRRLPSTAAQEAAEADFRRTAELGVTTFPTLLAVDGSRTIPLARGQATADEVDRRLAPLGITPTS